MKKKNILSSFLLLAQIFNHTNAFGMGKMGNESSGGGDLLEADLTVKAQKIASYLQTPAGQANFPEVDPSLFLKVVQNTLINVTQDEVQVANDQGVLEVRTAENYTLDSSGVRVDRTIQDEIAQNKSGDVYRIQINDVKSAPYRGEDEILLVFDFHELLGRMGLDNPNGDFNVTSVYPISSRIAKVSKDVLGTPTNSVFKSFLVSCTSALNDNLNSLWMQIDFLNKEIRISKRGRIIALRKMESDDYATAPVLNQFFSSQSYTDFSINTILVESPHTRTVKNTVYSSGFELEGTLPAMFGDLAPMKYMTQHILVLRPYKFTGKTKMGSPIVMYCAGGANAPCKGSNCSSN